MLVSSNVTMQFGSKPLFENISVKFGGGNRYGLIGANGSGKSTFMKILGGDLEPTLGNVSLDPNERIGKLRQDQFAFEEFTVLDTVILGNQHLYDIMKEKDTLYEKEDFTDEDGLRAADLQAEYAEMGGYEAESDASRIQVELDRDVGRDVDGVEFHVGRTENSYEIDASSGAIVKAEQELDD